MPDTHVEGAQHLLLRDVADLLHVLEDGRHGPGVDFDDGAGALGQRSRQVLGDAATEYMWAMAETASASIMRRMMGQ